MEPNVIVLDPAEPYLPRFVKVTIPFTAFADAFVIVRYGEVTVTVAVLSVTTLSDASRISRTG